MLPVTFLPDIRTMEQRAATKWSDPLALMERAAARCTEQLLGRFPAHTAFHVVVGMGNNGGDGWGIARQLAAAGRSVRVSVVQYRSEASPLSAEERRRCLEEVTLPVVEVELGSSLFHCHENEVIVDAILGVGVDRPLSGLLAEVVLRINQSACTVVAVDLPTGLSVDGEPQAGPVVRADITLTIQTTKPVCLFADQQQYLGECHVLDIGMGTAVEVDVLTSYRLLTTEDVVGLLPLRSAFGHKGTFGHVAVVAGSDGMHGAAVLAGRAAMCSGAGMLTMRVPRALGKHLSLALPEALVASDPGECLSELPDLPRATAWAIGPGIGRAEATGRMLRQLLANNGVPVVLDADALTLSAEQGDHVWVPGTVITPHPKEFDRLAGPSRSDAERCRKASDLACAHGIVVVLKGHRTAICAPDGTVTFNTSGNAGMAKGGSGDVLTGLLGGLLAQGLPAHHAAMVAVHVHGLAGDRCTAQEGQQGAGPSGILRHLPRVWAQLTTRTIGCNTER